MKTAFKEVKLADQRLFAIGKQVEILNNLAWQPNIQQKFLREWHKGNKTLPKPVYPSFDFSDQTKSLRRIEKKCRSKNPVATIVRDTARSYREGLGLVQSVGKKQFLQRSLDLYGGPQDTFGSKGTTTLRAAKKFLRSVRKFDLELIAPPTHYCILPETVVRQIKKAAKQTFGDANLTIRTDPKITSKASAGPTRIRVREGTCFAPYDVQQLIEHELLVHTLTLINGRKQKLKTLGLNSPRVTNSQEGLAVFAEFITNAMDVKRLKRISARVQAIQMGIDGADFVEVFEFFLKTGQSEQESFYSAVRIFRGGKVTGSVVFTKDVAYLKGFIEVHRFFRRSLLDKKFSYPQYFFAGRMCSSDVATLAPYFSSGLIKPPAYEPDWVKNSSTLLAFLLSSSVMNSLGLSTLDDT